MDSLHIYNCEFNNNQASEFGGSIYFANESPNLTFYYLYKKLGVITTAKITKCNFIQNQAYLGGAVFIGDQKVIIEDSIFEKNIATSKGGAIASLTQCNII